MFDTKAGVLVQGATGRAGRRHLVQMAKYGTNIVAGVSPTTKEKYIEGVPIFATCEAAVQQTGASISVIIVPPLDVLPAMLEALEAGCKLLVTVTEGVPISDCMVALARVRTADGRWIGPSTPGVAIPGYSKLGFLPDVALRQGNIGIVSKSGTLSYEIGYRLAKRNMGQSLWIGVGGDTIKGTRFVDTIPIFETDMETRAIVLIGEAGGTEEEEFAEAYSNGACTKPAFAIVAGSSIREGLTMGHAGALIHGRTGTVESKTLALQKAGIHVFTRISDLIDALANAGI